MAIKHDSLLKVYILLIAFIPVLKIGSRSFYLFELIIIGSFIILFYKKTKNDYLIIYLFIFSLILLTSFIQVTTFYSLFNTSYYRYFIYLFASLPLMYFINDRDEIISFTLKIILIVAIIGIVQTVDGIMFGQSLKINQILGSLYPYQGEMASALYERNHELMLKVGGSFRSTSTIDGQPILLGDFLAVLSIFFLYNKWYKAYFIIAIAVILTLSRGSWLILFCGFLFYFLLEVKLYKIKIIFKFLFSLIFMLLILYLIAPDFLERTIIWRLEGSLATFELIDSVERVRDPRTENVWPIFFDNLNSYGVLAYLIGMPTIIYTDSMWFDILKNGGLIGILIYFLFFSYLIFLTRGINRKIMINLSLILAIGFIVHPVFQSLRMIALLSLFIAIYVFMNKKEKRIGIY